MKTFYTVNYNAMGARGVETATFSDREKAFKFYGAMEFVDKPVAHKCTKKETIEKFEEAVAITEWTFSEKQWKF